MGSSHPDVRCFFPGSLPFDPAAGGDKPRALRNKALLCPVGDGFNPSRQPSRVSCICPKDARHNCDATSKQRPAPCQREAEASLWGKNDITLSTRRSAPGLQPPESDSDADHRDHHHPGIVVVTFFVVILPPTVNPVDDLPVGQGRRPGLESLHPVEEQ